MKRSRLPGKMALSLLFVFNLLGMMTGCGSTVIPHATVKGKVTLDGAPLAQGVIQFFAADPSSSLPPVSSPITNGEYSAQVGVGKMRVEIKSPKILGKMADTTGSMPAEMMSDHSVETLPEIYNSRSQLTCDVTAPECVADFTLKSR
ncbi:MAG: hypothetical protein U1A77_03315 [Pirellulales bacterium]